MKRKCSICLHELEVPSQLRESDGKIIRCPFCGATAPLWVRRRNHRVKGLKGGFLPGYLLQGRENKEK